MKIPSASHFPRQNRSFRSSLRWKDQLVLSQQSAASTQTMFTPVCTSALSIRVFYRKYIFYILMFFLHLYWVGFKKRLMRVDQQLFSLALYFYLLRVASPKKFLKCTNYAILQLSKECCN